MTPAELHAYVVARWTEHRALARKATPGSWEVDEETGEISVAVEDDDPEVGDRRDVVLDGHFVGVDDEAHVLANDPSHVIAVCDAALRRLARHTPGADGLCCWCDGTLVSEVVVTWPCPDVIDDAAPWADRSDFPDQLRRPA